MMDPFLVEEWKARSVPIGARMHEIRLKAEDSGLTDAERAEYARLEREWLRLFREFLAATREAEGRPEGG